MAHRKGRTRKSKTIHFGKSLEGVKIMRKKPTGAIKHQSTKNVRFYLYKGREIAVVKPGIKVVRR